MNGDYLLHHRSAKFAALSAVGFLVFLWFIVAPAAAQQIRCEDVSYSEVIVTKCSPFDGDIEDAPGPGSGEGRSEARAQALRDRGNRRGVDVAETVLFARPSEAELLDEMLRTLERPDKSIDPSTVPSLDEPNSVDDEAAGDSSSDGEFAASLNQNAGAVDSSEQALILAVWIGLLVIGLTMFVVGRWVSRPDPDAT